MASRVKSVHANAGGRLRLAMDGSFVLTGAADGSLSCHPLKRWPQCTPLWHFPNVHACGVTCVAINAKKGLAVSGGSDGCVFLYENALSANPVRRQLCRVSNEVLCTEIGAEGNYVLVGSDSVRRIDLLTHSVSPLQLNVKHPVIAMSVSPDGRTVAVASGTDGNVGIIAMPSSSTPADAAATAATGAPDHTKGNPKPVPIDPWALAVSCNRVGATQTTSTGEGSSSQPPAGAGVMLSTAALAPFVLERVLPESRRRDEQSTVRLNWLVCPDGTVCLAVPSAEGVRIFAVQVNPFTGRLSLKGAGSIVLSGINDLTAAAIFPSSKLQGLAVLASSSLKKVELVKYDFKKFTSKEVASWAAASPITDFAVDYQSGAIAYSAVDGDVAIIPGAILSLRPKSAVGASSVAATQQQLSAEGAAAESSRSKTKSKNEKESSVDEGSDDEENDDAEDEESSGSDSSADVEDDADSADLSEDSMGLVIRDLVRNNPKILDERNDKQRRGMKNAKSLIRESAVSGGAKRSHGGGGASGLFDDEAADSDAESDRSASSEAVSDDEDDDDDAPRVEKNSTAYPRGSLFQDASGAAHHHHQQPSSYTTTAGNGGGGSAPSMVIQDPRRMLQEAGFVEWYVIQPGQTPKDPVTGSQWLAFNNIGAIRKTKESVTVLFHDRSRPSYRLGVKGNCSQACLGSYGAVFVLDPASAEDDTTNAAALLNPDQAALTSAVSGPQRIYCRLFSTLAVQADWIVSLVPGEEVLVLATGKRHVAAVTTMHVRIFTYSGLEMSCFSIANQVVAMTGLNNEQCPQFDKMDSMDPLAVVTMVNDHGDLQLTIYNMEAAGQIVQAPVGIPLTMNYGNIPGLKNPPGRRAYLEWLGWSTDGFVLTADSAGVVRLLVAEYGTSWIPVHDPRVNREPPENGRLWFYGAMDSKLWAVRCPPGLSEPPVEDVIPNTELVSYVVPLLPSSATSAGVDKTMLTRQQYLWQRAKLNTAKSQATFYSEAIAQHDAALDRQLLAAFVVAVRSERTARALDLLTSMELIASLEEAARIAHNSNQPMLRDRIVKLMEVRTKAKKKRLCTLPTEAALSAEKERDRMLKKLWMDAEEAARVRNGLPPTSQPSTSSGVPPTGTAASAATPVVIESIEVAAPLATTTTLPRVEESKPLASPVVAAAQAAAPAAAPVGVQVTSARIGRPGVQAALMAKMGVVEGGSTPQAATTAPTTAATMATVTKSAPPPIGRKVTAVATSAAAPTTANIVPTTVAVAPRSTTVTQFSTAPAPSPSMPNAAASTARVGELTPQKKPAVASSTSPARNPSLESPPGAEANSTSPAGGAPTQPPRAAVGSSSSAVVAPTSSSVVRRSVPEDPFAEHRASMDAAVPMAAVDQWFHQPSPQKTTVTSAVIQRALPPTPPKQPSVVAAAPLQAANPATDHLSLEAIAASRSATGPEAAPAAAASVSAALLKRMREEDDDAFLEDAPALTLGARRDH